VLGRHKRNGVEQDILGLDVTGKESAISSRAVQGRMTSGGASPFLV
jgi:hypothetical protein